LAKYVPQKNITIPRKRKFAIFQPPGFWTPKKFA
jgi:hypothetical protein